MALSARQQQKNPENKKKRRKLFKKHGGAGLGAQGAAASYVKCPIHECLVPDGLFETGLGTIIVARRAPGGDIAVSAFVVDVFCLGVKNALFSVASEGVYENTIKARIVGSHEGQRFENTHPSCARKIIEGASDYARTLGFSPHPSYRGAKAIFGDVNAGACPVAYTFGQEGMPLYIRGPHESLSQARKIVDQLDKRCGEGKFHYLVPLDDELSD